MTWRPSLRTTRLHSAELVADLDKVTADNDAAVTEFTATIAGLENEAAELVAQLQQASAAELRARTDAAEAGVGLATAEARQRPCKMCSRRLEDQLAGAGASTVRNLVDGESQTQLHTGPAMEMLGASQFLGAGRAASPAGPTPANHLHPGACYSRCVTESIFLLSRYLSGDAMTENWLERKDRDLDLWVPDLTFSPHGADKDLHLAYPHLEEGQWDKQRTRSRTTGPITTHFGDLTDPIIDFIRASDAVVGCVAWLTATPILEALSEVETAIVVQKEDFLRPDQGQTGSWRQTLRKRYGALTNGYARYRFPAPFGMMNYAGDPSVDPVSCVGNHNADKRAAMPRMHHKFLVRVAEADDGIVPSAVWTGSFNFSGNAGNSFENAVEIHDVDVAHQYLNEFARVAALSEPLNWSCDWVTPQYRLGS